MKSNALYIRTLTKALLGVVIIIAVIGSWGCLTDPPAERWYNGAIYNKSDHNYWIALTNPPPEYGQSTQSTDSNKNYSIRRRFDAMDNEVPGVQSYYLREKADQDPAYRFEITTLEGNHVDYIDIRPNGKYDDAPDPVTSLSGLDWWYSYPDGGRMNSVAPVPEGGDQK